MKKIISFSLFVLFFLVLHSVTYSEEGAPFLYGNNDSLLVDGDEEYTEIPYSPADEDCQVVVVDTHCAYGDIYVTRTGNTCGVKDTVTIEKKHQLLKKGDVLVRGSTLETCPHESILGDKSENTLVALKFKGSETVSVNVELGPNSTLAVPDLSSACKDFKSGKDLNLTIHHKRGKLFYVGQSLRNLGKIAVQSFNAIVEHINTKFSVEIQTDGNDTTNIIKVYEGSVTVKLAKTPPSDKNSAKDEIDKLQKDFKDGKITAQEYKDKLQELSQNLTKKAMDIVPVEVTEGNKCIATNHSLTVEPIESSDVKWWDDTDK